VLVKAALARPMGLGLDEHGVPVNVARYDESKAGGKCRVVVRLFCVGSRARRVGGDGGPRAERARVVCGRWRKACQRLSCWRGVREFVEAIELPKGLFRHHFRLWRWLCALI